MLTLEQILNRTESIDLTKEFKINEHESIGGKPHISIGSENLERYSLPIKLHSSFCNPQTILDEIEEFATNRTPINYFQMGKYIGDFLIERYQKKIIQTINQSIFYAEITIDIVENPDNITEFEEQGNGENITSETITENSNIMKYFINETEFILKENSITNAIDFVNNAKFDNNLSQITYNNIAKSVLNSIKNSGLIGIYELIDNKINNLLGSELDANEINIIKQELIKIPNAVIDTALRG